MEQEYKDLWKDFKKKVKIQLPYMIFSTLCIVFSLYSSLYLCEKIDSETWSFFAVLSAIIIFSIQCIYSSSIGFHKESLNYAENKDEFDNNLLSIERFIRESSTCGITIAFCITSIMLKSEYLNVIVKIAVIYFVVYCITMFLFFIYNLIRTKHNKKNEQFLDV